MPLSKNNYIDIYSLIEQQFNLTPNAIAVEDCGITISYLELAKKVDIAAFFLHQCFMEKLDSNKEKVIALHLFKSINLIVFVLACIKSGIAYVAFEPDYPLNRKRYIINDCKPSLMISENNLSDESLFSHAISINVEIIQPSDIFSGVQPREKFPMLYKPEDLCYIIYSSGSTGNPKGILINRRGLSHISKYASNYFSLGVGSRVLQHSTFNWDGSVFELLPSIISGATLCIMDEKLKKQKLGMYDFLKNNKINVATITSRTLENFPKQPLEQLKYLNITSEVCCSKALSYWVEKTNVTNLYGPTEITICCCFYTYQKNNIVANRIGKPIPEYEFKVLDDNLQEVKVGETGELYIHGPGVGNGYLNLTQLSSETFLKNFQDSGKTFFKSGDFILKDKDNYFYYICRKDRMAKIGGYTLQLDEVDKVIRGFDEVTNCYVYKKSEGYKDFLYAVVEPSSCKLENNELNRLILAKLSEILPKFMIPSHIFYLDKIPMLPNGKIDSVSIEKMNLFVENF
jgi:amino acid adenylation domain-containing protein